MSEILCYRMPMCLDDDENWIRLSLKYRAVFTLLVKSCVYCEEYLCKGQVLSYGQYLTSQRDLMDKFNQTVEEPEDKLTKSSVDRVIQKLKKLGWINCQIITSSGNLAGQEHTLITITHPDTYNMIKKVGGAGKGTSGAGAGHVEIILAGQHAGQDHNTKKHSQDISETGKLENEKSLAGQHAGHIEKLLNNSCGATIEQQEQHLKTVFVKDNVVTVPLKSRKKPDGVNASRRFKLTKDQKDSLDWLKGQKIDTEEPTLCWWAKNYNIERLKDVHKYAIKSNPKSIGALMNTLLKSNAYIPNDFARSNQEFAKGFKEQNNWKLLEIGEKYVTCKINGILKELPLHYHPDAFVDAFMHLHELSK